MGIQITWLEAEAGDDRDARKEFLSSVHDLVRSFPEQCVATAIPFGANAKLTMLHIVAGSKDGELVQFSNSLVRQFETLAARFISQLSQRELEVAQSALDAREIGALSAASSDELAVVVGRQNVDHAKEEIGALLASSSD